MLDTQLEQVENTAVETNATENEVNPEEVVETSQEQELEIQVPENWEPELKDFINSIQDVNGKKAVFDKLSNFDKGYQKKFQDLASQRKEFDEERHFLETYRGFEKQIDKDVYSEIIATYGSFPAYMRAVHEMDIMASRDPEQFLINYCQKSGITMDNLQEYLSGKRSQEFTQTKTQEDLKAQILEEVRREQQENSFKNEVLKFSSSTDEAGNLLYPHFQELAQTMDALRSVNPDASLEELYKTAIYTRADLRDEYIKKEAENVVAKKEVQKAKTSLNVKSQIPSGSVEEKKDWRKVKDELLSSMADD